MCPAADDRPSSAQNRMQAWPPLPLQDWRDTYGTLHRMTQVVGKIRLACAPPVNHWWHVPLYVTARGLTTSAMPHGTGTFQIDFDFIDHVLRIQECNGAQRVIGLRSMPIAEFYRMVMAALSSLDLPVRIWTKPVEIEDPIPFEQDLRHSTYDPAAAHRFWQALRQADRVLNAFRSDFLGKSSPVHFFWGSFDLALTRFSGLEAPEHPGGIPNLADWVTRESYSRECSSCGFWPGSGPVQEAAFYAYAYPEPAGYSQYPIRTEQAYYSQEMREYILPYEAVRTAPDPDARLLEFLHSTYEAAAELGGWDRARLERRNPRAAETKVPREPAFPRHAEEG